MRKGTVDIIREEELSAKLERSRAHGKPLRVKLGADPTAPDIHLGHTVVIRKLSAFQELGHTVIFLIGDFTGSDRRSVRKSSHAHATDERRNHRQRRDLQAADLQDARSEEDHHRFQLPLDGRAWVGRVSSVWRRISRCAQILEREDFTQPSGRSAADRVARDYCIRWCRATTRWRSKRTSNWAARIRNSICLWAGICNANTNRNRRSVVTMPLLEGTDGVQKMSKSLGNYIGINETPQEMFGKIMSISDDLMWRYYELLDGLCVPTRSQHYARRLAPVSATRAISKSNSRSESSPTFIRLMSRKPPKMSSSAGSVTRRLRMKSRRNGRSPASGSWLIFLT